MGVLRHISVLCAAAFVLLAAVTAQQGPCRLRSSLLLALNGRILKVDDQITTEETVIMTPNRVIGMDYDYQKNVLYWADSTTGEIFALDGKSSKSRMVVPEQKTLWMSYGMAVEPVTDKLYVTDYSSGIVRIFDLRSSNRSIAISLGSDMTQIRSLAVDANAGYLFAVDTKQLVRIDLDGANRKVLLHNEENENDDEETTANNALGIYKIIVDQEARRLYWVDTSARKVESANYDGQDRRVHFNDSDGRPFRLPLDSLALLDGYLYWSDAKYKKVFKIDVRTGNSTDFLVLAPFFIKAVSCPRQRLRPNPCAINNGQCEKLCLLSRSSLESYKCACDIGFELAEDRRSCVAPQWSIWPKSLSKLTSKLYHIIF